MAKIAIIGAGRVGTAVAKILLYITDHEVSLIDADENALSSAFIECSSLERPEYKVALSPTIPLETFAASGKEQLHATLASLKPEIVVCATPFSVNIIVAEIAAKIGANYIDFTEDNDVTAAIVALNITDQIFVPQTGLAPGLINYLGLSLFENLGVPKRLELRVGALPQVSFGPEHYQITWSPEGLINEYLKPAIRKVQGVLETLPALDDYESIIVNGVKYEGFTTAGGVGTLDAYDHIPTVQYKTLRFPGHLDFLQKFFAKVDSDFDDAVELARQTFSTTRDDIVVLAAYAEDVTGKSSSAGIHFYPNEELNLTALELTTAGTGVAIIELMVAGLLPKGVLNASQIPSDKLFGTRAAVMIFDGIV